MELDFQPIIIDDKKQSVVLSYEDSLTTIIYKFSHEIISSYVRYEGQSIRVEMVFKATEQVKSELDKIKNLNSKSPIKNW